MKYLPLVVLLSACASPPRILEYSWGSVVAADGNTLARRCSAVAGQWDSGKRKRVWEPVGGCTIADGSRHLPEYWIDRDSRWCVLAHELAHGDGIANPDAKGYGCP